MHAGTHANAQLYIERDANLHTLVSPFSSKGNTDKSVQMNWQTDGPTDERMDRWRGGQTEGGADDGQGEGLTDGRTDRWTDGRSDGRTERWTDRRADEQKDTAGVRTDGPTDGQLEKRRVGGNPGRVSIFTTFFVASQEYFYSNWNLSIFT